MKTPEEVKIEFPCDYPIKAIGNNSIDLQALVVETVLPFVSELDETRISLNPSRKGTFVSVRFFIEATGPDQLASIHQALMETGHIKMVL